MYVATANDARQIDKIIDGQDNTQFESLKILSPGISWDPAGEKIAIAVKSGPTDAIAVVDIRTRRSRHTIVFRELMQLSLFRGVRMGDKIAFSGSINAQSDIFVLDLNTNETVNATNDVFSDHEPSWNPDGTSIVFHSDRGHYTTLGRFRTDNFRMIDHDYDQYDVYMMALNAHTGRTTDFRRDVGRSKRQVWK